MDDEPVIGRPTVRVTARMVVARDHHWPAHDHDFNELVLPVEGRLRVAIAGETFDAGPGDALHYGAGVVHEERAIAREHLVLLYLAWQHGPGSDPAAWPIRHDDRDGRIAAAVRWMIALDQGTAAGGMPALEAVLLALAHALARGRGDARRALVARVRAAIDGCLGDALSLDDLAGAAGLSRFHFVRAFRAATGMPPMRWLMIQRVDAARALMAATDMPLRAIAPRVGLGDEARLSRVVRRLTGKSPSDLRRSPPR